MFEFLPHPDIKAKSLEDLTMQTNDYLFRLKESLEFMLMSIDIENLSPEFRSKLDSIGVDIQTTNDLREDGMAQMASNALTVEDVINSPLLDGKIDDSLEEVEESIGKKANQSEVDSHTGNSTIHVTASEKNNWNGAVSDINNKMQITDNPSAYCDFRFPISDNEYYYLSLKPDSMKYGYYESNSGGYPYFEFKPNDYLPLSGGTVTGDLAVTGVTHFGHETISMYPHSGRIAYGGSESYGSFWRNDGATLYLMFTNKGDQYGIWNSLRPLFFNLSTGEATFGNSLGVHGVLEVNGHIKVGNNIIGTTEIQSANNSSFRMIYGDYGAFWHISGNNLYLMFTDKGNQYGAFNNFRPLFFDMQWGNAWFGHNLTIGGDLHATNNIYSATPVQVTSDRRAKENIENLDDRYLLLWDALQPKSYYMKIDKEKRSHIGYVAQEVEEAMQNAGLTYEECGFIHRKWVEKEDYKGYEYSLNYDGIGVIAQAKIKQQEERINALEKEIAELKALIINK